MNSLLVTTGLAAGPALGLVTAALVATLTTATADDPRQEPGSCDRWMASSPGPAGDTAVGLGPCDQWVTIPLGPSEASTVHAGQRGG